MDLLFGSCNYTDPIVAAIRHINLSEAINREAFRRIEHGIVRCAVLETLGPTRQS
jgi:hypothetical protein